MKIPAELMPIPSTLGIVTDLVTTGQQSETWWNESFVDDVALSNPGTPISGLRLNVRATSYGGEPDLGALTPTWIDGQGGWPQVVISQLVAV